MEKILKIEASTHSPAKRVFDIFFSMGVICVFSPLFLILAGLIKLSSKGPVFYGAPRVGRGGKVFTCWKLRTMYLDADTRLKHLLDENPEMQQEWDTYFKLKNDPRITPIGKWLRKTSLDEFPQFWNVLKGDLSVVGPRPLTSYEVTHYLRDKAEKILSIRPGLTGMWQTSGRNLLSYSERVYLEELYVEKQCFALDMILILKTIPQMLFPNGAF